MNAKKKFLFKIIAILIPFVVYFLIELILHLLPKYNNYNLIDIGPLHIFKEIEIKGEQYYKIENNAIYKDRNIIFPLKKKANTYRIFCVGGSASAGWPHSVNETFTTYLQTVLRIADTTDNYEVINCSAHGFASYRVKRVFNQVLKLQPDAIIIYSGNNEFLEERNYRTSNFGVFVDKVSKKLITVRLISNLFNRQVLSEDVIVDSTFLKKVQGKSLKLRKNPKLFKKVKEDYKNSISEMLQISSKKKIPVIIATVPVNLKDWLPNVSYNNLKDTLLDEWTMHYNNGKKHLYNREYDYSIESFQKAINILPDHAETYFWMAKAYERKVELPEAIKYYNIAKDLDYNPFRAISFFNRVIAEQSHNYKYTTLVDLEQIFIKNSETGIPGFDLFLDYVHPTKEGNILIASSVFNAIKDNKILPPYKENDINVPDTVWDNISDYDDNLNILLQATRFSLCCINHQYKSAVVIGRNILKYFPEDLKQKNPYNKIIEKINEGVKAFMMNIIVDDREVMGAKVSEQEKQNALKSIKEFYDKWYSFGNY